MYPSYTWPGACSISGELKLLLKKIKEFIDSLTKRINKI